MTFSRSQRTVPAMGTLIVWSEEERAKIWSFEDSLEKEIELISD
jgi:hypothetical protein